MDKPRQRTARVKNEWKILIWLGLLISFAYSYQAIIDWEPIIDPNRHRAVIRILTLLTQPNLFEGETSHQVAGKMWETMKIAFLATRISAIFAIPFTFFSARASSCWGRGFNILLQPILAAVRSVHPLIIVAPIAIVLAWIGPTAGVLALTLFSNCSVYCKLFRIAQQHTSLSWSVLLQVYFPGLAFRHFPINILIATVLGFLGGGGIGFSLQQDLSLLNYSDAGVAILAIIIASGSLDLLSRIVWYNSENWSTPSPPEKEEKPLKSNTPLTPR